MLRNIRRVHQRTALYEWPISPQSPQKILYDAMITLLTHGQYVLVVDGVFARGVRARTAADFQNRWGDFMVQIDTIEMILGRAELDRQIPKWGQITDQLRTKNDLLSNNVAQLKEVVIDRLAFFNHLDEEMSDIGAVPGVDGFKDLGGEQLLKVLNNPNSPYATQLARPRGVTLAGCNRCADFLSHLLKYAKREGLKADNKWAFKILRLALCPQRCHHMAGKQKELAPREEVVGGNGKFAERYLGRTTRLTEDTDKLHQVLMNKYAGRAHSLIAPEMGKILKDLMVSQDDDSYINQIRLFVDVKRRKRMTYGHMYQAWIEWRADCEQVGFMATGEEDEYIKYPYYHYLPLRAIAISEQPRSTPFLRCNPLAQWRDIHSPFEEFAGRLWTSCIRDEIPFLAQFYSYNELWAAIHYRTEARDMGLEDLYEDCAVATRDRIGGSLQFTFDSSQNLPSVLTYYQYPKFPIRGEYVKKSRAAAKANERVRAGIRPETDPNHYDSDGDMIVELPVADSVEKRPREESE